MNRRYALAAVLLAAIAAAVYLLVLRDGDDGARADAPAADEPGTPVGRATPTRAQPRAVAVEAEAPREPQPRERADGSRVRDHRTNPGTYVRPALPHRDASPVTPAVTAAVMRALRPVVLECFGTVPDAAFAEDAVVMTSAKIAIDDAGEVTTLELGPAVSNIDEAAAADALACVRGAAARVRTKVDHPAVAEATLAFPIRPLDYRR